MNGAGDGRADRGADPLARALRAAALRPGEGAAVLLSFAYFFALLSAWYAIRPLREVMGIQGGVEKLHWVFTGTFVVMLAAVPLWSALVARVPRARAVPVVYRFFLASLLAFWLLLSAGASPAWTARAFFVWTSVFNLFVVSVFWSLMADLFTAEQGKRLFGLVSAGGSAGAIAGPLLAAGLVGVIGVANLLLLSALLLEVAARLAAALARRAPRAAGGEAGAGDAAPGPAAGGGPEARGARRDAEKALGGSAFAGFAEVARSPYLLALAGSMALFSLGNTFLYFQQARIVAEAIPSRVDQARLFGLFDLGVNVLALATQALATGHVVRRLGLGVALGSTPAVALAGFGALAAAPGLPALVAYGIARRSIHFALEKPAREVLFTVVPREEKYKAKAFVDTVVYRGGDAAAGWAHAGLVSLGLTLPALALAAIPAALAALLLAAGLARAFARREAALAAGAGAPGPAAPAPPAATPEAAR